MKKKFLSLIALLLVGLSAPVMAQTDDDDTMIFTNEDGEEEEIDMPEAMTYDLDSLLHLYYNENYLNLDADCNLPDVNPVYSPDEYIERLQMLPTVIEMPYNEVVQKFIDRYSGRLRRSVALMLGAQNFYMPIFEQALESYGLPLELKYLPVIESALNPRAVSRVGATGLWQFMLATGKQYKLEVNSLVDERRDPILASNAAAHYLSDLYKIFGDWNLVIAAYNCGPENINKAIHRADGKRDYWEIYPYLPKETRGYVPAFIAANYIMNYYCEHNICPLVSKLPQKTDTIMINRDVHFEQIAHTLGISVEYLQELNPQYRRDIVNGNTKPSSLRLPANLINSFIDNEDSIYAYNADQLLTKRAVVDVTEEDPQYVPTKQRVRSKSSRTSVREKRSGRGKTKESRSSRRASKKKSKKSRGTSSSVTVRKGETLSEIARKNGTTVSKLRKLNKISGSNIQAGKKIKVK